MANFTPQQYETAFQARQACCRALLELSREQSRMIADDQHTELLDLLNSKQALIDHLSRLAAEQEALRLAWPSERGALAPVDREKCNALLAETETLLATLLEEEQASSLQLMTQRDATQRELQNLAVGVQTKDAYDSRAQSPRSRFDVNL